jgi:hypothetical protein
MKHNKTAKKHTRTYKHDYHCEATYHSLHKWYEAEFEKLGWMILAKAKGMDEKVMNYKHAVNHLEHYIVKKLAVIHDKDKKMDLHIMLNNVQILKEHISKDF